MAANLPGLGMIVLLVRFLFPSALLVRVFGLIGNLFLSAFFARVSVLGVGVLMNFLAFLVFVLMVGIARSPFSVPGLMFFVDLGPLMFGNLWRGAGPDQAGNGTIC